MAESLNETIAQQRIRSYEISIWTLQDRFLSVLKWSTMDQKGQVQDPEVVLRDDGTEELSFVIPKFYYSGAERIQNPMWLHLQDQPLEANMHKLKVIFNKNYEDERVFEFLVTSVTSDHAQDRIDISVKAEGLAFHELGKVGYKIALSQENYELELEQWIKRGMYSEKPRMNIQYWNDLIFKDSNGNWRTNWRYEVQMDWSSYSRGNEEKDPSCVYEDEYVSSWQLDASEKLMPRYTEGYKEKWRPVEIKESNIYNATQTIAEKFGVFCRYEYEHDENYQITGKKVIYYNNYLYDKEGHIDLTYPYSSSGITRTIDNSSVTTKLFVTNVEQDSNTISIMDVDANKSREDYLLCFDYLKDVNGINEDQYEAVQEYEAKMHKYNTQLSRIQERIRILTDQIVKLDADYTTYDNAYNLDNERYEEALKGRNSITGGKRYIPVDTHFIVMEDNTNGLGLYIRMRFEGMDEASIKLYAKSNFVSMNGSQYSEPVSFSSKRDDYGQLTYLYNLQGNIAVGDSVYLTGMRDPYSYYKDLMDIWTQRKNIDYEKRKKAEEDSILYNWYLRGSRVGYGLVGAAKCNEAYYGIMTTAPFDGTEEALAAFDQAHPYVTWYVGSGRIGKKDEIYDYDNEYDHFEEIDKDAETADLYYFQEYFLKQKEIEYNRLEKMLGPALREGYWTPEDYHDYGDQYEASFRLSAAEESVEANNKFNDFIKGSMVYTDTPDSALAPHLQVLWDCNKYYDNEEPLVYTSSISDNRDQHLVVDLSNYLKFVKDHLDDLCLFYVAKPIIETIDDISGEASGLTNSSDTKLNVVKTSLQRFAQGKYINNNTQVGSNYYSKLQYFINADPYSTATNNTAKSVVEKANNALKNLRGMVANLPNTPYTELNIETLTEIANNIYNLRTLYETIRDTQESARNKATDKTSDAYKNADAAYNLANNEYIFLDAAYKYLMGDDASIYDWSKPMKVPGNITSGSWTTTDCGLLIYIKQYQMYENWIDSLSKNCYYSFQVNSQAELGWVLDTQPHTNNNGIIKYTRFPTLIVTGAKTLDADTIRLITTNQYTVEKIEGTETVVETRTVTNPDYLPFLGYYKLVENADGTKTLTIEDLQRQSLNTNDFIGASQDCTIAYTRNLKVGDYDGTGNMRQPYENEYRYRRVYPRLFFNTIKLKNTSSDLYVNINGNTLDSFKDYSVVTDDRSVGQRIQGVGYYLTLKPSVLFQYGENEVNIDVSYTLSNSDVAIYLDAIKVMRENAYPKVSYDVELSVLNPEFVKTAYNRLNQIVHINDNDLQLEEVSGYISTVNLKLDKPWEDTVEIKNYETKFEDLFTTIVAQTEAMKKSSQGLDTALQAFSRTTGLIDSDVLYNSMLNADLNLSFNQGTLTIDQKEGIWGTTYENEAPVGVVAFRGGGIFTATEHDSSGNWIWNTGILPSGINASLITTGQLDTNKIKVFAGDQLRFQLNGEGLYAYKLGTTESSDIQKSAYADDVTTGIDSKQYVVFNSEGLFLTAEEGAIYASGTTFDSNTGVVKYDYTVAPKDVNRVEVSWKGLILRNWQGNDVFYADNYGNLTLKGTIEANAGTIGGWNITSDSLSKDGINLFSTSTKGAGIALAEGQIWNVETVIDGEAYYTYHDINNSNKKYYLNLLSPSNVTKTAYETVYVKDENSLISVEPRYQISDTSYQNGTIQSQDVTDGIELTNTPTASTIIYVGENSTTKMLYNGQPIIYNFDSTPDTQTNTWYDQVCKAKSNYQNYINEVRGTVYTEKTVSEILNQGSGATLTLVPEISNMPTFSVYANDGETTIKKGTIGNFNIDANGLSSGTLTGVTINNDNKFIAKGQEQPFGKIFYDIQADSDKGIFTLTRINGEQVNFNIAAMKAYQDAVAAAATITLQLVSQNGVVIATATNNKGVTVTKQIAIDNVGSGSITAIATSGNGVEVRKTIIIQGGGVPDINNTIPSGCTSGCKGECKGGCGQSCQRTCAKNCIGSCGTECALGCGDQCAMGCTNTCSGSCELTCTGGCGGVCANSCNSSCKGGCEESCYGTCRGYCYGCTSGCIGGCKGTSKSGGGCFTPSTLITLSNQQKIPIFKITKGMELAAYDETQKKFKTTIVIDLMKFNKKDIMDIILSNGNKVTTTQSHPFLTKDGWKAVDIIMGQWEHNIKVQELHIGDFVLTEDNNFVKVVDIVAREDLDNTEVYNIDVSDYSTYLANGLVVHNADQKDN